MSRLYAGIPGSQARETRSNEEADVPRKRKNRKVRLILDLRKALSNPFAALNLPWEQPGFPLEEAKAQWQEIREEEIARWAQQYSGRRPWPYWRFDWRMAEPPHEKQAKWLQQHGQLTPYEQRTLRGK